MGNNDGFSGYPWSLNSSLRASNERGSSSRNCLRIYDRHLSISLYQIIRTIWLLGYFNFKATFHIWSIYNTNIFRWCKQIYSKRSKKILRIPVISYFLVSLQTVGIYLCLKIKIMSMILKHVFSVLIKGVRYEDRRRSGATKPAHILFCLDPKGDVRILR